MSTGNTLGVGVRITSVGWQVTLCDPIWQVVSRCAIQIDLYFTLLYTQSFQLGLPGRREPPIHQFLPPWDICIVHWSMSIWLRR